MKRICVVEDEESLSSMLELNLSLEGYKVETLKSGGDAVTKFKSDLNYDLIILDVMLPQVNGIEICKEIRKTSEVPVLFLSAKGTTSDRVVGLKAGGNDYLPKPFDLEELLLKVGILTNANEKPEEEFFIGKFEINFKQYNIKNLETDEILELSKREIALLKLFHSNSDQVVSRNDILDVVWGKDVFPTSRTIDNYILNFRKIFEDNPKSPKFFHSIRGVGYKFTP